MSLQRGYSTHTVMEREREREREKELREREVKSADGDAVSLAGGWLVLRLLY